MTDRVANNNRLLRGFTPFSDTAMQVVPAATPALQVRGAHKMNSAPDSSKEICAGLFAAQFNSKAQVKPKIKKLLLPRPWWESLLAESIHQTLRKRESMIDTIKLASPQLKER